MLTPILIVAAVGYLLGSLPFGYLVARAKGVNIFEVGSKNPGATNVRRVLGSGPGNLVFFLDALKGAVAAAWPALYLQSRREAGGLAFGLLPGEILDSSTNQNVVFIAGLVGALVGHSFSCFTKFRGGKGVATATGGLLTIIPISVGIAAVVWAVTFLASRYVSLASMLAAAALPISVFILSGARLTIMLGVAAAIAAFVIIRHRTNIQRLLAGTEAKFVKKPKAQTS